MSNQLAFLVPYRGDIFGSYVSPENVRLFFIFTLLAVLAGWESLAGGYWRLPASAVRQSYSTNFCTWIFNDVILSLASVASLLVLAERYSGYGFVPHLGNPWLRDLAALISFDLTLYLWHRANHRFECLWRFHKVHHSDRLMNVTTAFRLHAVEVLLTTFVKAVFIIVTGVDVAVLLFSEILITANVMFHHANVAFRGESRLGRIFVMPSMHRAHHSTRRDEHDNNYGALFSVWDRCFGTSVVLRPKEIGLKNVAGQNFIELLIFGFRTSAVALSPQISRAMIAEAAYYRAEKRGFAAGNDVYDWLEAEKELSLSLG